MLDNVRVVCEAPDPPSRRAAESARAGVRARCSGLSRTHSTDSDEGPERAWLSGPWRSIAQASAAHRA